MSDPRSNSQKERAFQANLGTGLAFMGLGAAALGILFLIGTVSPLFLGVIGIVLAFFMIAFFHYFTWGFWLSQAQSEEEESDRRFWESKPVRPSSKE